MPVAASQILQVPSSLAETTKSESGLIAVAKTLSVWPVRVASSAPVAESQILAVSSELVETMKRPFGLIAQAKTPLAWPARVRRSASDSRGRVLIRNQGVAPGSDRQRNWGSRSAGTGSASHCSRLKSCCQRRSGRSDRV